MIVLMKRHIVKNSTKKTMELMSHSSDSVNEKNGLYKIKMKYLSPNDIIRFKNYKYLLVKTFRVSGKR